MARKVSDKELLKFAVDSTIGKVLKKIEAYWYNPHILAYDIHSIYHTLKYYLLKAIDPPPRYKSKESAVEYFDRIHPRHGMRFYELLYENTMNVDLADAYEYANKQTKNKEARKLFIDLMTATHTLKEKNGELYQRYKIKNELLKSHQ